MLESIITLMCIMSLIFAVACVLMAIAALNSDGSLDAEKPYKGPFLKALIIFLFTFTVILFNKETKAEVDLNGLYVKPSVVENKSLREWVEGSPDIESRQCGGTEDVYTAYKKGCKEYHVTFGPVIGFPIQYENVFNLLKEMDTTQTAYLHYSNFGGYVWTGSMLMNSITETKAKTISVIDGPSYSMSAVLACATDELIVKPYSFLMYHTYRGGFKGNGQEILSSALATERQMRTMLKMCVKNKVLTQEQVDSMLNGKDLYIFPQDLNKK